MKINASERLSATSEYYFSVKLNEIEKKNAAGLNVINLAIGNPNMKPAPAVINTLNKYADFDNVHGYQTQRGSAELRSAFAKWYLDKFNVELNPENEILSLIGSKEGIFHLSFALLNPGDKVLIPDPAYPMYKTVAGMMQAEAVTFDLEAEKGWLPDLDKLEAKIDSKTKMIWVNYPNMPSGASATPEFFEKLIELAKRKNILVVNDNPYSFILNENKPLSILSVPGAKDYAVELNSLSKSHSFAGWRTGAALGNSDAISLMLKVKSNIDSGIFLPIQKAAITALSLGEEWYTGLNKIYSDRQRYAKAFAEALGCIVPEHSAGMYLWAKLPENSGTSHEFAEKLLEEKNVFISPGTLYGNNGEGYIRISLCQPVEKFNEAIKRL